MPTRTVNVNGDEGDLHQDSLAADVIGTEPGPTRTLAARR
jgi:hypothetical protein